jgi:gamma-glutamyltranspeptidase / glutathione hydrolase
VMKNNILLPLFSCLFMVSCQNKEPEKSEPKSTQFAQSTQGMAVAAQPLAAAAGQRILEIGGNAADAAIATSFVLAVVEPTMNGIGGRSQILIRKTDGSFQAYNAMTEIPAAYLAPEKPVPSGYGTIAIPGLVAGLMRLHKEHGSLPLEIIMESAINIATQGFEILPGEAARHQVALKFMRQDPGLRRQMLKQDSLNYKVGEVLKQPDLAQTLTRIAKTNGMDFYHGETAQRIADDMHANGGFVTATDLANYKALNGRYLTIKYRDYDIHTIAAPAGGGLVVKALNILEQFDLQSMNDVEWATIMNQALAIAANSRFDDYEEGDLSIVASKSWAIEQAKKIRHEPISKSAETTTLADPQNYLASAIDWSGNTWGANSHHTTHFATADCQGMVVSITQTLGPLFGSKVITPGLGFVYAATMGEYLSGTDQAPGARPRTTIAPTIITKNGVTIMALGAAGGLTILSGIVQTISRFIDQNKSLRSAVLAPRIEPIVTFDSVSGNYRAQALKFNAECTPINGWAFSDTLKWQNAGFEVTAIEKYGAFSRVHALSFDEASAQWSGAADADWEGAAFGARVSDCPPKL